MCTLSNIETDKTPENLSDFMGSILEGKSYNFKLSVSEERKQGLVGLSLLYKTTSDRIKEGWSTSEFTKEDEEANLKGEYPAEQAE